MKNTLNEKGFNPKVAIDNVKRLSKGIKNSDDVKKVIHKYDKDMKDDSIKGKFKQFLGDLKLLGDMVKDAWAGRFKLLFTTLALLATAIAYILSPIDLIPDYIPVIGLIDDAAVISWVFRAFAEEIEAYKKWKKEEEEKEEGLENNMKEEIRESSLDATIAYWDNILESYGKLSISLKKPESVDKILNDNQAKDLTDFDDAERNPYGVFSPDLMNAGMKNGFANTWFVTYPELQYKENSTFPREDLEEYPKEEFLDSCADNVIAEAHDIVHQTAMLVGPMLYVDNIANWARGYDGNGETYVSFEPDLNKSTVTLVVVQYGSYDGFVFPLDFASKAALQSLLNDIYEMMPYLLAFETADAKNISFKIPREMMNEIYDNYLRRPFKWEWTKDLKRRKEVKQSLEDKMWNDRKMQKDRNPHVANKALEIDAAWKAHDKKEI